MWKSLFHVTLFVNDIDKTLDYYKKLGLEVLFHIDNGDDSAPWNYYLRVAKGQYLEIQPVHSTNPHAHPDHVVYDCNQTIWHFSLETDNIVKTFYELREQGIQMWKDPMKEAPVCSEDDFFHGQDGCVILWLVDPDGNPIEVMEQTKDSLQQKYDHD